MEHQPPAIFLTPKHRRRIDEAALTSREANTVVAYDTFLNTRARLQRVSDGLVFHGWVESFEERDVTFRIVSEGEMMDGEDFFVHACGLESDAKFVAKLVNQLKAGIAGESDGGSLAVFDVLSEIRLSPPSADPRLANQDMSASFYHGEELLTPEPVELRDVSLKGLSTLIPVAVTVGSSVRVHANTLAGFVDMTVEVRNCTEVKDKGFRVGCLILSMHRIDELRWRSLFRPSG